MATRTKRGRKARMRDDRIRVVADDSFVDDSSFSLTDIEDEEFKKGLIQTEENPHEDRYDVPGDSTSESEEDFDPRRQKLHIPLSDERNRVFKSIKKNYKQALLVLFVIIVMLLVFFLTPVLAKGSSLTDRIVVMMSIVLGLFWSFQPLSIDPTFTSMFSILILLIGVLNNQENILASAANSATWLIVLGTFIGHTVRETTFPVRIGMQTFKWVRSLYLVMLILIIFCAFFSFVIPSGTVRLFIVIEIAHGFAKALKKDIPKSVYSALYTCVIFAAIQPGYGISTGNLGCLVVYGSLDAQGITISFFEWLKLMGIVYWLFAIIFVFVVIVINYSWRSAFRKFDTRANRVGPSDMAEEKPVVAAAANPAKKTQFQYLTYKFWSFEVREWLILLICFAAFVVLLLDQLLKVNVVAVLAVTTLALHFPFIGPSSFDKRQLSLSVVAFACSVISLGNVFNASGHMQPVRDTLTSWIDAAMNSSDDPLIRYMVLFLLLSVMCNVMPVSAVDGIIVPILVTAARKNGLDPKYVSLTLVMANGSILHPGLFGGYMIAFMMVKIERRFYQPMFLMLAAINILVAAPITLFMWRYIYKII